MKFGRVVCELIERTDRQTDTLVAMLLIPPTGELTRGKDSVKTARHTETEIGAAITTPFFAMRRNWFSQVYFFTFRSIDFIHRQNFIV